MSADWTDEQWAEVLRLRDEGVKFAVIGARFGLTKNAVQGRIYRRTLSVPSAARTARREGSKRLPRSAYVSRRGHIEPARAPYAPDDSCPDFAWDDVHCGAVTAAGGFPVLDIPYPVPA
jgi:hypothetical protein